MKDLFANAFEGQTVLVTGHTGFKGSWLTAWLLELGARVVGFSLDEAPTTPSNFVVSGLSQHVTDVRGDIRDLAAVQAVIETYRPTIVFHLAAQPIVFRSLAEPKLTLDTNAMGTVNVLEAVRATNSVKSVVCVTTDKVYANQEWIWGYRESDPLGDYDPYSASKAMAELAIASYRESYFPARTYDKHGVAIATVRAGNVIGGGDFADYRLVPDCMRALMAGEAIQIRNPLSVRPWQHVLEPISGYMWVAVKLLQEGPAFAEPWNFGPLEQKGVTAGALAERLVELWGSGSWVHTHPELEKSETGHLRLSWDKAATRLDWRPVYNWEKALAEIVGWYKIFQSAAGSSADESANMHEANRAHLQTYVDHARAVGVGWTR
ncbi:MAG: CDP-glucose 4,6-dehydratase [Chloroflexi bacterium]|nr:CDP-glucose 4,6-dehydratase [Chloroflexota bacterium]